MENNKKYEDSEEIEVPSEYELKEAFDAILSYDPEKELYNFFQDMFNLGR